MHKDLAKIIRTITTKGEKSFVSSLKEELDSRLNSRMANYYMNVCESLFFSEPTVVENGFEVPISESSIPTEQKPVTALILTLQESIKEEKTIVHKFTNGDTVAITNEDSRCLVNLHDSLNKMNQEKMRKLMSESYSEYNKILQFSRKYIERTHK